MNPRLSVVMPTYNAVAFLEEAIDSVLSQTFSDFELIIIDDNSKDGTREIINSYKDTRIHLIDGPNKGISSALNAGLQAAKGEYIARMDADDISLPERFEKQIEFLDSHDACGMVGCKVEIFGDKFFDWKIETCSKILHTDMLFYSPCPHPTVVFRASVLRDNNLFYNPEFSASEDYEFFARVSKYSEIANIDKILLRYRLTKNNTTFKKNDIGLPLYLLVMKEQFKALNIDFLEEDIKLLCVHYSFKDISGEEVIKSIIKVDLLLKKIFIANEKVKMYDKNSLFITLHKRFKEIYDSLPWMCVNYDVRRVEEFYVNSVFYYTEFYSSNIFCINHKITIVMPAYNSEKYIMEAIWSLLIQTFTRFELLIIYDRSDDETLLLINAFSDSRIHVIYNEEKVGVAAALNQGILQSKTELIARADADDMYPPNRLEVQYNFMSAHPDIGVCGTWQRHFGLYADWIHKPPVNHDDIKARQIYACEICHSTIMLRKSLFVNNDLFYDPLIYAEDYELWQRAIEKIKFANIPQILGYYRVSDNSMTRKRMTLVIEEAGKITADTIMRNFEIHIPESHIKYLQMWENKFDLSKGGELKKHLKIERKLLQKMWKKNESGKVYNPDSLLKVINHRWNWIKHYEISDTILPIYKLLKQRHDINCKQLLKKIVKRIIRPFYLPVYNRCVGPVINLLTELTYKVDSRIRESEENILKTMDGRIWKSEENILKTMDGRIWKSEENILKLFEEQNKEFDKLKEEIHRHIDFTYRDIMVVLENRLRFAMEKNVDLETDYPIAYKSMDHIAPHGTIRDNTRFPRFIKKCEEIFFTKRTLIMLDLGCSGGGMVLDGILRGHYALGLEGSDLSLLQQRAEWRLLPNHLKTCDITKPFFITNKDNGERMKFDVITAWEVLEHIHEEELSQFFMNLKEHLATDGIFVGSIANWDDVDPVTGVNWHVTKHPYNWWEDVFRTQGFTICTELFAVEDLARGGYNPPHCYEIPYSNTNELCFHIAVKKEKG